MEPGSLCKIFQAHPEERSPYEWTPDTLHRIGCLRPTPIHRTLIAKEAAALPNYLNVDNKDVFYDAEGQDAEGQYCQITSCPDRDAWQANCVSIVEKIIDGMRDVNGGHLLRCN